jgi:uncharacterized protein with ATP-grasp and redox domains
MKIHPECMACLFERAKFECDLAFGENDVGKLGAMIELAKYACRCIDKDTVPALIGTERGRIISRASGVIDPYVELKLESNRVGLKVLPIARRFYKSVDDKFLALLKIAAAANSMEYGVRGHSFDEKKFKAEFRGLLNEKVSGDIRAVHGRLKKFTRILYILDNAGEVVLDKFVIDELASMGKEIVVSPKSEPVINDVTYDEVKDLGFEGHRIVPSGAFFTIQTTSYWRREWETMRRSQNLMTACVDG